MVLKLRSLVAVDTGSSGIATHWLLWL